MKLNSEIDAPVTIYPTTTHKLLIWFPSEFGLNARSLRPIAQKLQTLGYETWLVDLQAAYFAPRGRKSIALYKVEDTVKLLQQARRRGKTNVYLIANNHGASHALKLSRYWQLQNKNQTLLHGLILLHPALYRSRPTLGQQAHYQSIVSATNLSVYIIQPQLSSLSLRSAALVTRLRRGGSAVFFQFLPGVKDGFFARSEDSLSIKDKQAKQQLPVWIDHAVKLMAHFELPKLAVESINGGTAKQDAPAGLQKVTQSIALNLSFKADTIKQQTIQISHLKGKVVLVSFWASWCPPCIRELPSLNRLQLHFANQGLKVITVNIGESREKVLSFSKKHHIQAEIVLDPQSQLAKNWNVYIVPTNYIIDRTGKLRYGSVGAVNWDDDSIRKTVQSLLAK